MSPEIPLNISRNIEWSTVVVTSERFNWSWLESKEGIALAALVVAALVVVKLTFSLILKLSAKIRLFGVSQKNPTALASSCCGAFMVTVPQENCSLLSCSQCGKICNPVAR